MVRSRLVILVVVPLIIGGVSGCGSKVRFEKEEEIDAAGKTFLIEGPTKAQKVKVEVTADDPVTVKVFLDKEPNKTLAKAEKSKEVNLEVEIPAGEPFSVSVEPNKKTKVSVKVNSSN